MAVFLRNISFHGILLDALFEPGNADWQTVHNLVSDGIQDGTVKPLQSTVFDRDDIEAAFRFMGLGKHVGKVLIKVKCLFFSRLWSLKLVNYNRNIAELMFGVIGSPLCNLKIALTRWDLVNLLFACLISIVYHSVVSVRVCVIFLNVAKKC